MRKVVPLFQAALVLLMGCAGCEKDPVTPKVEEKGWRALPLQVIDRKVQCIAVHPDHPATLYVGLFDGLYKSTDGGSNWHSITTGLNSRDIKSVEIVADNPQRLYCGSTGFGISRSDDGGESWTNLKGEVANTLVNDIHLVNQRDETIWLATATGIYRKGGGEEKWTNTFLNSRLIHAVTSLPGNPATLLAGLLYTGFARTTDAGARWYYANSGVEASGTYYDSPVQFAYIGADSGLICAVTVNGDFYTSQDAGQSWKYAYGAQGQGRGVAVVTHPRLRDRLYLANTTSVFRSTDRGATWSKMSLEMPAGVAITALQVANGDPGVVYIGTEEHGLYSYTERH